MKDLKLKQYFRICFLRFDFVIKGLIFACFSFILHGNTPMDPIYDLQNATSLKSAIFNAPRKETIHLFPVPQENSVGTNDLGDTVNVFQFSGKRIWTKTYFANSVKYISNGGHYLPVFDPNKIGFAKERFFVLGDFSTRKMKDHNIVISLERTILKVDVADSSKNRFFFEIESENPNSEDYRDVIKSIWLVEIGPNKPNVIKKIRKQQGTVWSTFGNQLFLCDFVKNELMVYDSNLNLSTHSLVDVINKNKGIVDFVKVIPHQTMPFAILSGGSKGGQYVCWNQSFRNEKLRSLFGLVSTINYVFSPDGRWVVFQKDEPEPKYSYIMPVSEKYPNYLGSPILLEGASFDRDHFAWTTNPVALVGASEGKLYRYDLTKEAHPEAASYPSYWDYVVEKDLEKLRKAGKQGLKPKP